MRTTWTGVPKEVRDAGAPLLAKYGHVLPGWVRLLEVTFDDAMTESFAEFESEPNYHRAKLILGGGWLNCDQEKRDWLMRHELSHAQFAPIDAAFEYVLLALSKRMRVVVEKMYNDAVEEAVSGLAYALVKDTE